jgi:p-cumate 2,3-dioxygenase alpha subunit
MNRPRITDDRVRGVFRVPRASLTSSDVLDAERRAMERSCWFYLRHDSEVEAVGAYVQRTVLGRSIIFVRGSDGAIGALYNSCSHKGAAVVREPRGTAKHFQCFYHAWTFDAAARLVSRPDEAGYAHPVNSVGPFRPGPPYQRLAEAVLIGRRPRIGCRSAKHPAMQSRGDTAGS